MGTPQSIEFVKDVASIALNIGKFVAERLVGGAWSQLPHPEHPPATPPVRANVTYVRTEEV